MKKLLFVLFMISFISCNTDEVSENPTVIEKKSTTTIEEQRSTTENASTQKNSLSAISETTSFSSFPIHRFWDGDSKHLYPRRMDYALEGVVGMYPIYEGVLGYVNTGGSVPLYLFKRYSDGKSLWSINPNEANNSSNWQNLGIVGYVKSSSDGNPVYRYFNKRGEDHFYTQVFSELGNGANGYVLEGIAFYM